MGLLGLRAKVMNVRINSRIKNLRGYLYYRITQIPLVSRFIKELFHVLFYDSQIFGKTWNNTFWLGTKTSKCPFDLWVYQEIIYDLQPDIIIECGTARGGSALYLASLCELIHNGIVITIDIVSEARPQDNRVKYLTGSSTSGEIVGKVQDLIKDREKVMVILDSNHKKEHVLDELIIYSKFVSKNSYLIVEDTHLNNHPVLPEYGHGPMEAVTAFLKVNNDFEVDRKREKYYLTFNPNGFLRKIR